VAVAVAVEAVAPGAAVAVAQGSIKAQVPPVKAAYAVSACIDPRGKF
jgi:hypothetical protein